eukprot:jgi/Ulvmu1/6310/UM029_0017.1
MSVQWWAPTSELLRRMVICGHRCFPEEIPAPARIGGRLCVQCPVCYMPQATVGMPGSRSIRDGVPGDDVPWGQARPDSTAEFGFYMSKDRVRTVEALLAWMHTNSMGRIHLDRTKLRLGRSTRDHRFPEGLVMQASAHNCTVVSGLIELPETALVLLKGSGAAFHSSMFSGGVIVCCGQEFTATFTNCTFDKCTLYAVQGARVTLRDCKHLSCDIAPVASCDGTALEMHGGKFIHSTTAVIAEGGATACAAHCEFEYCTQPIVTIGATTFDSDAATRSTAVCRSCTMRGLGIGVGYGVYASHSAIELHACTFKDFHIGVMATGEDARADVRHCVVLGCTWGVSVQGGGLMSLRETTVEISAPPRGTKSRADDPRSCLQVSRLIGPAGAGGLQVERCVLRSTGKGCRGVDLSYGGAVAMLLTQLRCSAAGVVSDGVGTRATLMHCDVESGDVGLHALGKGKAAIEGGRVSGEEGACIASVGGVLSVRGALLRGLPTRGAAALEVVAAQSKSTVRLSGSVVQHGRKGLAVSEAKAYVRDTELCHLSRDGREDAAGTAGLVNIGGQVNVVGGSVRGCSMGFSTEFHPEMQPHKPESITALKGVVFDGNVIALQAGPGARVSIDRCEFKLTPQARANAELCRYSPKNAHWSGVVFNAGSLQGSVQHSTFEGCVRDIHCQAAQNVPIRHCHFKRCVGDVASIVAAIPTEVIDCTFNNTVCAITAGAPCLVVRCRFLSGVKNAAMQWPPHGVFQVDSCIDNSAKGNLHSPFQIAV